MTTDILTRPSPSRNPFARPSARSSQSGSFTRTALLPAHASPTKAPITQQAAGAHHVLLDTASTPAQKPEGISQQASGSASKKRDAARLLWRGGLELGESGWRLDGITFFALLLFPSTPSINPRSNPFDETPIPVLPATHYSGSPFPLLPSGDMDLCLSLESMRGRKFLAIRGVVDLPEDEILDGDAEEGGVQIHETLSATGRTLKAITIGLGDEGVEPNELNSSILIYGQLKPPSMDDLGKGASLQLRVGRRKPPPAPPSAKKVRPGDPLPRAPMFFPAKQPARGKTFSRATSISSIYLPPPKPAPTADTNTTTSRPSGVLVPLPLSGRTPGRRGEKRKNPHGGAKDAESQDERRRKQGKIVAMRQKQAKSAESKVDDGDADSDIFGKRPATKELKSTSTGASTSTVRFDKDIEQSQVPSAAEGEMVPTSSNTHPTGEALSTSRSKRIRVPQQILDNKATIRKQTLLMLESRGFARDHEVFKDVFSITTKGTYFAFRDAMENEPLLKTDIQDIVARHLDMYLPLSSGPPPESHDVVKPEEEENAEPLLGVKEEEEDDGLPSSVKEEAESKDPVAHQEAKLERGDEDDAGETLPNRLSQIKEEEGEEEDVKQELV